MPILSVQVIRQQGRQTVNQVTPYLTAPSWKVNGETPSKRPKDHVILVDARKLPTPMKSAHGFQLAGPPVSPRKSRSSRFEALQFGVRGLK